MIRFKRGNNPGKGKDYEINMLALMCLRLFNNNSSNGPADFDDFDIGFNLEGMGKMDDLVFVLKKNSKTYKIMAIQLKQKEKKTKKLTETMLETDKGDYSLLEHAATAKNIYKNGNYEFILFSNIKYTLDETKPMTKFQIIRDKKHTVSFLNTAIQTESESESPYYNFRIQPIDSSYNEHKEFFEKFLLIPNQSSKRQINDLVQKVFENTYNAPNSTAKFMELIHKCYDKEEIKDVIYSEPRLDKIRIGKLLVICLLNQFLVNVDPGNNEHKNQWNVFKKVANQFLVTVVNADIVKKKLKPSLKENYELWENNNNEPIIVKIDIEQSKPILAAIEIIKKINLNKKLIIIGELENCNEVDKFTNLSDVQKKLKPTDLDGITNAFHVSLSVDGLIDKDYILETVTPTILFDLVDNYEQEPEELPEHYVSRTMQVPYFTFNEIRDIIKEEGKENLVILKTYYELNNIKTEMRGLENKIFTIDEFLQQIPNESVLIHAKTQNCEELLKKYFNENDAKNVYFFNQHFTTNEKKDDKFDLISSHGPSIKLLENPQFKDMKDEDFSDHHSRINILCADPGMGKTSSIKFLRNKSKNCYSKVISFKDHVKFFRDYKKDETTIESILKYFLNIANTVESLRIQCYLIKNRVCLFFDGLDELDSKYLDNAINCIQKVLTSPQIHKVLISARKHLKDKLESNFKVHIIEMSKIDKNNQKKYIEERLLPSYDKTEIIDTIYNNFRYIQGGYQLLEIPLQLYMITEVLNYNTNQQIDKLLVLSNIYYEFLNRKVHVYRQKKTQFNENVEKMFILEDLNTYKIFGLRLCLDSDDFSKLDISENYEKTFNDFKKLSGHFDVGIVFGFIENKTPIFEHRTISEYLCALYFVENFKKIKDFHKFIFNPKYDTIRFFMDMEFAKNSKLHLAVINRNDKIIFAAKKEEIRNAKDAVNRNLLQLSICYYKQDYPELKPIEEMQETEEIIKTMDNEIKLFKCLCEHCNSEEEMHEAYKEPETVTPDIELKLFKYLCEHCNRKEEDELFGWSSINYAISIKNLCAIDSILKFDKANEILLEYCKKNEPSILGYSSINGFNNLLNKCSVTSIIKNKYCFINNYYQKNYINVIHLAAKYGQLDILKQLIQLNLDINCQDKLGNTAIHYAAQHGNVECLIELINHRNLSINCKDKYGYTALHLAAQYGKIECLIELIKNSNLEINCLNNRGHTALHLAVINVQVECLTELIHNPGLNINIQDKDKNTALHCAVIYKTSECLKELIKHSDLDINCQSKRGFTALHYAAHYQDVECLKEIMKHPDLDINCQTPTKYTALHHAALNEEVECLKELIKDRNLDINCLNKRRYTALHLAVINGKMECVKELIKHSNFDINCQDEDGCTALHYAAQHNNGKCLKELIKNPNWDINCLNNCGHTALDYATANKKNMKTKIINCEEELLTYKVIVGTTPLWIRRLCWRVRTLFNRSLLNSANLCVISFLNALYTILFRRPQK